MDHIKVDIVEAEPKLVAFATGFLSAYTEAIDRHWSQVRDEARQMGALHEIFPLYGRTVGEDVAIAALRGFHFAFYFVQRPGVMVAGWADKVPDGGFNKAWLDQTPEEMQNAQMREALGLSASEILYENTVGTGDFILAADVERYASRGAGAGNRRGMTDGQLSVSRWSRLQKELRRSDTIADMARRYHELLEWEGRPQERGQEFERLWRDCLNFHGWHAHKIRIPGEDNDFTAIYNGLHIVGEVKWQAKPMTSNHVREFLAKLDPRPQSIGMYVSHSGIDDGAVSAVRRAVNSKTVLLFDRTDIEMILLEQVNPGSLFDEKLRKAYDLLFEEPW